jgi:HPt (histidine-containing phosphotransfer) domain-containing protein
MSSGDIPVKVDRKLADLLPRFVGRCRDDAAALRRAADASDWAAAKRIGHTLFGSGEGYGLDEVTTIGRDVDSAGSRRDAPALRQLAGRLEDYLARIKVTFE